jgi:NADH:ubiquinone oxidoreductase subunit F (NADH-binding)
MTALLAGPRDTTCWAIGPARLLAGMGGGRTLDLAAHLAVHGPIPATDRDHLLTHLDQAQLAGRGGAGFPLAAKIRALRGRHRRVVVNGSESEPGSGKDRLLLRHSPNLVLDGALAVAGAVAGGRVSVAVHDESVADAVRAAVAQRRDARRVEVRVVPDGFVAGESRALARALRGAPAVPPGRREPPTAHGVLVANVETFAQTAVLLRLGPRRFAESGTVAEPGTTLLSVGGAVGRPGVVEIPLGTPLSIVLAAAEAQAPVAVVTGGYHGTWLPATAQPVLSRAGLSAVGGTLGAGVLLVVGGQTCPLGELARVAGWLAGQSAQQCGPCRFGLPALAADVLALQRGEGSALGAAAGHLRAVDGRGACAHPSGAVRFLASGLDVLRDEIDRHRLAGGCGRPVLGQLPTGVPR